MTMTDERRPMHCFALLSSLPQQQLHDMQTLVFRLSWPLWAYR